MNYKVASVTFPAEKFQPMLDFAMELSRYFLNYGWFWNDECKLILHGQLPLNNQHDMCFKQKASVIIEIAYPVPITMPAVYCSAPWLRCEPDWHTSGNGHLCWELPLHWEDEIGTLIKQNIAQRSIVEYAVIWCINSVISLLGRQWYAFKNEIKQWPKEWECWQHGQKGIQQYEQKKRKVH